MSALSDHDLQFVNGFPTREAAEALYDELDLQRAVQVYLRHMAAMSMYAFRRGIDDDLQGATPQPQKVAVWEDLLDAKTPLLTGNTEVIYACTFLNLDRDGPTVIEAPPGMLGILDDMWCRYVADIGAAGPDKAQGGSFLVLPPDYTGESPKGYFTYRSPTYGVWVVLRGFLVDGKPDQAVANLKALRIYPLSSMDSPPAMELVNASGRRVNTLMREDYGYYEDLAALVSEEYGQSIGPEDYGMLASIGIVKGRPFEPDERLKTILTRAAEIGRAMAKTILYANRDPDIRIYTDRHWLKGWIGGNYDFSVENYVYLDARALFYYFATGNTPAMVQKAVGVGSQYLWAAQDSEGDYLDGGQLYKLTVPPNVPARQFWSLIVYDVETRSLLQRDDIPPGQDFPSLNSYGDLKTNSDGSIDIYLGPEAPPGYEANSIRTVPGKGFTLIFRLYAPLEPYFDQSWKLNDLEKVS